MHEARCQFFPTALAALITGILFCACGGCVQVDATADFEATARIIRARTGASGFSVSKAETPSPIENAGDTAPELDREQAVALALMNNPEFRARLEDVGIARADLVAAGIPSNPLLTFSARAPTGPGLANLSGTILQTITELLLIPSRERVARARLEKTHLDVARAAVELAASVREAWNMAVARRTSLTVIREEKAVLERARSLVQDQVDAGLADVHDLNLAKAQVLDIQRQELVAEREARDSLLSLRFLLGLARSPRGVSLRGALDTGTGTPSVPRLLEQALTTRLDVEIAILEARAADLDLERASGEAIPALSVGIDVERPESPPSILGPAIEFELPVFGTSSPEIARTRFAAVQARRRLQSTLDRVAREVRTAALGLESSQQMIRLYEESLIPAAEANVAAASRAYSAGTRDILILIEAERTLIRRRRGLIDAMLSLAQARSALLRAVGSPFNDQPSPGEQTR